MKPCDPGSIRLLTSRRISKIGTWNVRTMYATGKSFEVASEFRNYDLDILGISETHLTGIGEMKLSSGETILYSGNTGENATHSEGVGIIRVPTGPGKTWKVMEFFFILESPGKSWNFLKSPGKSWNLIHPDSAGRN